MVKKLGLCRTCDNRTHCVLTREEGVVECEEFFANGVLRPGKIAPAAKQVYLGSENTGEELQD